MGLGLQRRDLGKGYKQVSNTNRTQISGFPGGSVVKNLPAVQETWARSLGQEDPLEEEIATHSNFLAWRIPWTKKLGGLQSTGLQRLRHD